MPSDEIGKTRVTRFQKVTTLRDTKSLIQNQHINLSNNKNMRQRLSA
jgi:hypothetical protein